MPDPRPRADRDRVARLLGEIRAYHREGCRIRKRLPNETGYNPGVVKRLADELGWNETRVRKARQFADPALGYTGEQLLALCDLVRTHRPVFGTASIGLLVTVPWEGGRAELQRRCIEENWSRSELEAEIKRRFGNRRSGGRRRRVVAERGPLLVQLGELLGSWQRWFAVVSAEPGGDSKSILERHLGDMGDEIGALNLANSALAGVVAAKLKNYRKRARE